MPPNANLWASLRGLLIGPTTIFAGIGLLGFQVYLWQSTGFLYAWLIGMGIGLTVTGAGYWFYRWDDHRHDERFSVEDHDDIDNINADEYDRRFEAFEEDERN